MQSPSDGNAGSGTGTEQYYAIVQPIDEEMYAEIESAASSVTYARIEPRQVRPSIEKDVCLLTHTFYVGLTSSPGAFRKKKEYYISLHISVFRMVPPVWLRHPWLPTTLHRLVHRR